MTKDQLLLFGLIGFSTSLVGLIYFGELANEGILFRAAVLLMIGACLVIARLLWKRRRDH